MVRGGRSWLLSRVLSCTVQRLMTYDLCLAFGKVAFLLTAHAGVVIPAFGKVPWRITHRATHLLALPCFVLPCFVLPCIVRFPIVITSLHVALNLTITGHRGPAITIKLGLVHGLFVIL